MIKAWWYGPRRLLHGDGRKVQVGKTLTVKGEVVLCKNGLHASVLPLDALQYGIGHFWRVGMGGTIVHGDDKLAASERTHLWRVKDTDAVLRHFARLCALDVIHLWAAPGIVVRYLKTGDESLRDAAWDASLASARAAARDAARVAARVADGVAAGDAARAATLDASGDAVRATTLDAIGYAARAAARDAARAAQNKRLHRMLLKGDRDD